MAISSPLLLKIGAGAVAATSVTIICVLNRENISRWFSGIEASIDKVSSAANLLTLATNDTNSPTTLTLKQTDQNKDKNIQDCVISLKSSSTLKSDLEGKIGTSQTTLNEKHKKYRRGLLWKCYENSWKLTEENNTIDKLFNFSNEKLTEKEKDLTKSTNNWTVTIDPTSVSSGQSTPITVTVTVSQTVASEDQTDVSVETCKITGTSTNTSLDTNSLKDAVNNKVNPSTPNDSNKSTWRKNFLEKCKRSYDEQINLTIKDNTWEKLKDLFNGNL